jgi:hypothetical protein
VYEKILNELELLPFLEFLTLEYKARPMSQTVGMPTSSRKIPVPKYTTLLRSPGKNKRKMGLKTVKMFSKALYSSGYFTRTHHHHSLKCVV